MRRDVSELLQIYLEKRANLVRFFAARLGSVAAAEDLLQELYLKIATLDDAVEIQNPAAFLYRTGANLMLDRLRQERRGAARDGAWREMRTGPGGGEDVADEPAADDALASRERLIRLAAAVEDLPPQMQRAFRLHKLDGLSQAETARRMEISISAVEKHISAALKVLLKRLE